MKRFSLLAWGILLSICAPHLSFAQPEEGPHVPDSAGVYEFVDQYPVFTGPENLIVYLVRHAKYPEHLQYTEFDGFVNVRFVVNKQGAVRNVQLVTPGHPALDSEALRVVRTMPRWKTGTEKGRPVAVYLIAPVLLTRNGNTYADDFARIIGNRKPGPVVSAPRTSSQVPLDTATEMPRFKGVLDPYLREAVNYPQEAREAGKQGRITVRFVVEKDGQVTSARVRGSKPSSLTEEALRVVNAMPRWIPGRQNGIAVAVYQTVSITFSLQ